MRGHLNVNPLKYIINLKYRTCWTPVPCNHKDILLYEVT